ncbi:MAG: hypothetical protein HEP71_03740 [Roseivirga sp.]|nr:hypothetical protein [Roseivirga sp.]
MKNNRIRGIWIVLLSFFVTTISVRAQKPALKTSYEPNTAYPYGRSNPDAPEELQQFAFLIGTCECSVKRFTYPDAKSISYKAVWTNSWTMNGWAIKDRFFSPYDAPISIRIYDVEAKKWKMTYFIPKPYYVGEWTGQKPETRWSWKKKNPLQAKRPQVDLRFMKYPARVLNG